MAIRVGFGFGGSLPAPPVVQVGLPVGVLTMLSNPFTIGPNLCPSVNNNINSRRTPDANTLAGDDFCRGEWYHDINANGEAINGGWYRTGDFDTLVGTVASSTATFSQSSYAASSGAMDGSVGGRFMAQHPFRNQSGQLVEVDEAWIEYFVQPQADYNGGHEKMLDMLYGPLPAGGGQILELTYNYFGSEQIRGIPYLHQDDGLPGPPPGGGWMQGNAGGNISLMIGRWLHIKKHIKLNTPGSYNGVWELWGDDCGTDGSSKPANPTLRGQYNNVLYRNNTTEANFLMSGVWIENWANPASVGTLRYKDLWVSRVAF